MFCLRIPARIRANIRNNVASSVGSRGEAYRCHRASTPTDKLSWSEKFLECLANTGVKSPLNAMFRRPAADANGDRQPE
jgi:hypothetical protein